MGPETGALVLAVSGTVARARTRMGKHVAEAPTYRPEDRCNQHGDSRTPASNRFSLVEKPRHRRS